MNRLKTDKRTQVIAALAEGASINATCRMTGVAKHTVLNLLRDLGCACAEYHNKMVRNLKVRRVQCDEIWAFCYAKDFGRLKNCATCWPPRNHLPGRKSRTWLERLLGE